MEHDSSNQFEYLSGSFTEWLLSLGHGQGTVKRHCRHLREYFCYLHTKGVYKLHQLSEEHHSGYVEYMKYRSNKRRPGSLKISTINGHLGTLNTFSRFLQLHGLGYPDIQTRYLAREPRNPAWLTREEIRLLYEAAGESSVSQRDTVLLDIFYGCGLRLNEGSSLALSDVDFRRGLVLVREGKNGKQRHVPATPGILSNIRAYISGLRSWQLGGSKSESLFINKYGQAMKQRGFYHSLERIRQHISDPSLKNKPFSPHTLRHSVATHLMQSGLKLEDIALFLGHASIETTQLYTHLKNQ